MNYANVPRAPFIDHLRGFVFALMAIDHALHAYALHWGRFWFFKDYERSLFFDGAYLFNQSILMPLLFFIVGLFVVPSLERRGFWGYLKERAIKLGIPFLVGVPLIVPLLSYPRYEFYEQPGIGYFEFWTEIFFTEKLQAGPFWVLYALMLYSLIAVILHKLFPELFRRAAGRLIFLMEKPVLGFIVFGLIGAIILGVSDLKWGAPWWIGFGKIFYLQGARFLHTALFFATGVALGSLKILEQPSILTPLKESWKTWCGATIFFGIYYIAYALLFFHDGAYSNEIRHFFHQGGEFPDAWPVIFQEAPMVLARTTLLSFLCLSQLLALMALFQKFLARPSAFWGSLARNAYGIFLIHETLVVWMQYGFGHTSLPIGLKFLLVGTLGLAGAWLLNDRVVRKFPGFRRILDPPATR